MWLNSFLENRSYCVFLDGVNSSAFYCIVFLVYEQYSSSSSCTKFILFSENTTVSLYVPSVDDVISALTCEFTHIFKFLKAILKVEKKIKI